MKVLLGTGAAATALSWWIAQHSLIGARWLFLVPVAVWVPLWLLGARAATRIPARKAALIAVLVLAAALRLAALTGTTPSVSNDLYRYGWDARVQLAGIDPYRYPPDAPQLRSLRQPLWFPPGQGTTINRPGVRTIYPPVAEAWFTVVSLAYPGHDSREWQLAGAAVDMATIGLLVAGLSRLGRDPRQVAWYALGPIPVIEFAGNGHVDGLAVLLLVAALLALQRGRRVLAGFLIGLATMVKLYPGLAALAAWKRGRWPMLGAVAATSVIAYAPHVAAVGTRIVGYLPGYLQEEHYNTGGRFLLLSILPVSGHLLTALAVTGFLAAGVIVVRTGTEPVTAMAVLLTVVVLIASPVQPWYAVGLAAFGALIDAPWLIAPALLSEGYYAAVILDTSHQVAIGRGAYGLALLIIAVAWLRTFVPFSGRALIPRPLQVDRLGHGTGAAGGPIWGGRDRGAGHPVPRG